MYSVTYQDHAVEYVYSFYTLQDALDFVHMEYLEEEEWHHLWEGSLYDRLNGGEKCIRIAWAHQSQVFLEEM
jgi:hypothetical protein